MDDRDICKYKIYSYAVFCPFRNEKRGRRGRDRMEVGFTITYAISAYSPLMLRVRISIRARCTTWCDKVCQWLATGRWFSPSPPVSSTNKTSLFLSIWLSVRPSVRPTSIHPHAPLPSRYNWDIVESGVKQHQTNRNDRNYLGGGVLIYITDYVHTSRRNDF